MAEINQNNKAGGKKRKAKKKPVNSYLYPVLMGSCLLMFVLSVILPDRMYSSVENQPLAQAPFVSWNEMTNGEFQNDEKTWFADQFPGRNLFFHLDYLIRKAGGQREIKEVFSGKKALLGNPEAQKDEVLSRNLNAVAQISQSTGLNTVCMVVPSAAMIQPEELPAHADVRNTEEYFQTIASFMQTQPQIQNADAGTILKEHADDYIYYRTDHHWTTLGAGLGTQALLQAMSLPADLTNYEMMPVSSSFEGTLAAKTGSVFLKDDIDLAVAKNNPNYLVTWADNTKSPSIYVKEALEQKDQYQLFLGANQSKIQIDTDADTDRVLLLFKDSYANSAVQYLLPFFSSITIIDPRYYYDDLQTVLDSAVYTDIAFVYSCDIFVTVSSLADLIDGWNAQQSMQDASSQAAEQSDETV